MRFTVDDDLHWQELDGLNAILATSIVVMIPGRTLLAPSEAGVLMCEEFKGGNANTCCDGD